jgi:dihydroneopterin aldolase
VESTASECICVEQLEIFAHVGVTDNERRHPQRMTLTLKIWPNEPFDKLQDEIGRTINYSEVSRTAREFIEGRSDKLIETLASQLASRLLDRFPAQAIEVELRKFVLPNAQHVAVIVKRSRGTGP